MIINVEFDANALAAPAAFRNAVLTAASLIGAALTDNITINIAVGYGEIDGTPVASTSAEGGPSSGHFYSYSQIRSLLVADASPGDTTFNSLPAGSSIQGQSQVAVWYAEEKALGLRAANDPAIDGYVGFGTGIPTSLMVGVALHEIGHAMGRVPYGPEPDIFDLFRFTSPGTRLFDGSATAPPAYFSIDGGVTDLADYGQSSDSSDFLNGPRTPEDPFNEYYDFGTLQHLTTVDLRQFDANGFHLTGGTTSTLAKLDFNNDGRSDVLWRQAGGPVADWSMNGSAISASYVTSNGAIVVPDASWSVAAITDFNGDHKADLLWRNASGLLATWFMNGSAVSGSNYVNANGAIVMPDPSWNIAGIGDLNGDGKSDLLWRDTNGSTAVWVMDGSSIIGSGYLNVGGRIVAPDSSWSVVGMGDFNGDNYSDLIWRNTVTGELAEWQLHSSDIVGSADLNSGGVAIRPDASWSIAGVGDFNGDGDADLLWLNSNGTVSEWLMHGSTVIDSRAVTYGGSPVIAGAGWKPIEIGDFNGDGNSDMLWRNSTTGQLTEFLLNGNVVTAEVSPSSGGAAITPDLSWSVPGKPTNFA